MRLNELLIQYEIENNLTHVEMADRIGVSFSTYYRWMRGESTKLKKTTINKLSEILDCDVEKMLEETSRVKPILGKVKAGYNFYAQEDIEGYIELGKSDASKGDYFLRVTGDSMEGYHIFDGDLIFVEQCQTVPNGAIGVVCIGDEVTVKKIKYKNGFLILEAANPKYDARFFTPEEIEELGVKIIGLVKFVRMDFVH